MARYDFWTHGVNTIPQFPALCTTREHTGVGTRIGQNANTTNWFHIPIPTPTALEGDTSVNLGYVRLRASVNENAEIEEVQLLVDGQSMFTAGNLSLSNTDVDERFNNPNFQVRGGLVMSVRVRFLTGTPGGRITIKGAGARFEQAVFVPETMP
ncbi:MAG TPA: DUF6623 family protein [Pyrinomonadaceae bacterium]|nr:DUF6623 family protein [Pyrinomonadaceae bacterium]